MSSGNGKPLSFQPLAGEGIKLIGGDAKLIGTGDGGLATAGSTGEPGRDNTPSVDNAVAPNANSHVAEMAARAARDSGLTR